MAQKTTILNVDDQDAPRYVKTRDLEHADFKVVEARTGSEALRMIEHLQPPVVLLDVQLPDISGYDVCRYVKQKWPRVMILMTSATFTSSADRTQGLDSGADSFLVQPAEPLELIAAVKALLRIRRSEDELRKLNDNLEQRVEDRTADLAMANVVLKNEITQREKAEAALVQAEKMQAVGQLTGGLAHDFNNLLTAVLGNIDLIRTRSSDARILRLANNALTAVQRGSKLTSQLLAFSRTQQLARAPVDINTLVLGMEDLINRSVGASVAIERQLEANLPPAMADANQIELAILNLCINARDAMPSGGTLTIATKHHPELDFVSIRVSDIGIGMPPEVAARAFDPFYSTKPPGKGTGLGLSQVYGIAKQSGGDISLQSEVGSGTTVTLYLPRSETMVKPEEVPSHVSARAHDSERLLIVDDDHDVREIMAAFMSELGYQVRDAEHGQAALQALSDFCPDAVILDFAMPGMNGAEAAVAIRERCPNVPLLFVSGFADSELLEKSVGKAPLLRKPFRPAELATAVRSVLENAHRPGA